MKKLFRHFPVLIHIHAKHLLGAVDESEKLGLESPFEPDGGTINRKYATGGTFYDSAYDQDFGSKPHRKTECSCQS